MTELPRHGYSDAQLDGLACVRCGRVDGPMVPVADGPRGQLFQHVFDLSCPPAVDDD